MFTTVSMTGTGLLVLLVTYALQWLGVQFDANQVTVIVKDVLEVGGWVLTIVGQLRRKDLSMGIFKNTV